MTNPIRYFSTRDTSTRFKFSDILTAGLAAKGGLYIPDALPPLDLKGLRAQPYPHLAATLTQPFLDDTIPYNENIQLWEQAFANFRHPEITPLTQLDDQLYLLELFHGPTYAFKDFALQWVARLIARQLKKRRQHITILAATSGDTGAAAIQAFANQPRIRLFVLFPHNRIAPLQRLQMTTEQAPNVQCLAVQGSFDDCQNLVKTCFNDRQLCDKHRLVAVNSINFARVLAQATYYAHAILALNDHRTPSDHAPRFAVPTGNFGNIYAGWMLKKRGMPIEDFIIACNQNDSLYHAVHSARMTQRPVKPSLSPAMDIQISSNFERLLFALSDNNPEQVKTTMALFKQSQTLTLNAEQHQALTQDFKAEHCNDTDTLNTIAEEFQKHGQILDPHSAIGVAAARRYDNAKNPIIALATAHPGKFPDTIRQALEPCLSETKPTALRHTEPKHTEPSLNQPGPNPLELALPEALKTLEGRAERVVIIPPDLEEIRARLAHQEVQLNA